ncbi:MAG: WcaF family extracellular polysaccharide biosynthesis acetyltransferase [Bacteroidetes bacterium]|nr:WcaF family extracellular polysaccharide biosynthesis acetyltransferase [Bacteroidota bacterium]
MNNKIKTDLAAYNNAWYRPGNPIKRACWYFVNTVFFRTSFFPFSGFKVFLLKLFGAKAGQNILIKPAVNIKYPWFLKLGNNVWIGEEVWIDNLGMVSIGDNVCLSQGSMILSGNHDYTKPGFNLIIKEIMLEDGVWIGAKAIVCNGVVCKSHSVLLVGSVAVRCLEAYGIYQGNPAVKVKDRNK